MQEKKEKEEERSWKSQEKWERDLSLTIQASILPFFSPKTQPPTPRVRGLS